MAPTSSLEYKTSGWLQFEAIRRMDFKPMNRPPNSLKLSIYLGRVIFEEQWLYKFYIFSPKSDFRIAIVCPYN